MIYLRNLIAKQEIYVAEFYIERKAYIAALGRADYVIKYMSKTPSVERALEIMVLVYEELKENDLKLDASEALTEYRNKKS
jgi:outer membrane protein assembly factor BamD